MSAFRYVPVAELATAVLLAVVTAGIAAYPAVRRGRPDAAVLRAARVLLAGAVLAVLVVTMNGFGGGVNLVPGAGIQSALNNVNSDLGLLNLFGNVAMFMPVGFLLMFGTRLRIGSAVCCCAVLSLAIELVQLTGRAFDVDDVLLNSLGGFLGAALGDAVARAINPRVGQRRRRRPAAPALATNSVEGPPSSAIASRE